MKETKFKQTEVGMIPSDWEVKTIGSFCKVYDGTHQTPNYVDFGIPFYSVENVSADDFEHTKYISLEEYTQISKRANITQGDILMTRIGSIGVCKYVDWNCKAGFYVSLALLKCNDRVDARFICHLSNSENFKKEIELHSLLTAIPQKINLGPISDVRIALPKTIEEQQRIANALSDVDSLINNLEKLIAKKKNIKQGAMQQLLTGKKRLPGFGSDERTGSRPTDERRKACHSERSAKREVEESSGYKMTELGLIPSDWEVKTFGELFDILPNNTLSRAELNEDSGSFKNIHYGDVLVKFPEWIDCSKNTLPFINSGAKFNHTALQDGDVIIADTAEDETVGKSTEIYNVGKMKIVSGLHTIPIRPKKKFASKWLGYFINSACWHDQILPFITGTKVSAISKTAIAETKFFYPAKIDEQTAIANVLSDMDTEISALETKLAKYRTLKTGMMQQLLTGKIRLV